MRDDDEFISPSSAHPDESREQAKQRAQQNKAASQGKLNKLRRLILQQELKPAPEQSIKEAQARLDQDQAEDSQSEKEGIIEGDTQVTQERLIDRAKSQATAQKQAKMEQQDEAA